MKDIETRTKRLSRKLESALMASLKISLLMKRVFYMLFLSANIPTRQT